MTVLPWTGDRPGWGCGTRQEDGRREVRRAVRSTGHFERSCAFHSRTDVAILDSENVIARPLKVRVLRSLHVTDPRTHNSGRLDMSWLGVCSYKWLSYVNFGVLVSAIAATWMFVIV